MSTREQRRGISAQKRTTHYPYQDKREDLHKARLSPSGPYDICQLTYLQGLGDSICCGESVRELIESVSDCSVLHDVTLVEDIWSRWGDLHEDLIMIGGRLGCRQCHLLEKGNDFCGGQGQAGTRVDI